MPSKEKLALARFRADQARANATFEEAGGIDLHELDRDDPMADIYRAPMLSMNTEEMVLDWVLAAEDGVDPIMCGRARRFFELYSDAIADLETCPAINRLVGLKQFGVKRDPRQMQHTQGAVATAPYVHDRWTHSRFVAAHVIGLMIRLGYPLHNVAVAAFAALLHDVGYPAFSHDGDEVSQRLGLPHHEVRGQIIVKTDLDVREALALAGVNPDEVLEVMAERGDLGSLLRLADTLAYVVMDRRMIGGQDLGLFSTGTIFSVTGVQDGILEVQTTAWIEDLVRDRAGLSREVYYHPNNMVAAEALKLTLEYVIRRSLIPLKVFIEGTDSDIEHAMTGLVNNPRR
ncbi:MAG: HD domain-containing protein, partial [Patescibacteria group bacterium]